MACGGHQSSTAPASGASWGRRTFVSVLFVSALGWAQFREGGEFAARLEVETEPSMPVRVYLFKNGRPFRFSPVEAMLPLRTDLFYRERLWRRSADPSTLEVTCADQSHFFLLKGRAAFELPAGDYRIEAYRGHFYEPFEAEFTLSAGKTTPVVLRMKNWLGEESSQWLSSDDHIHLVRAPEDDGLFLSWMEAEDLSVGNFLQLQRQMDAAVQYGFGPKAEARRAGRSIRSGHESRAEFFGHINLLGGREIIRPLSAGSMYANSPETYPYPNVLFERGRKVGATVGYAHFHGSMPHSTLLMDLALGSIDFLEVFQFGKLWSAEWYELLNAGLVVAGVAGSDFPVYLNRLAQDKVQSRWLPLLGPERALVKAKAGQSAYEAWADGVRKRNVVVTNGPLVELRREGNRAVARARFYRPLASVEIVADGKVIASEGGGTDVTVQADFAAARWIAARTVAVRKGDGPEIQAHTNPIILRAQPDAEARAAAARRWEAELAYYRQAPLVFPDSAARDEFFARAEEALRRLRH
jgi:hypothetical protein